MDKAAYVAEVKRPSQWAIRSGLLPPKATLPDYDGLVVTTVFEKSKDCIKK